MKETLKSEDLTTAERELVEGSIRNIKRYSNIGKGVVLAGFVILPDWKKPAPILRQQVPMAVAAVLGCFGIDYLIQDYYWKQTEPVVKRVTGYNGEMYINPESMKSMKEMYKAKNKANAAPGTAEEDLL